MSERTRWVDSHGRIREMPDGIEWLWLILLLGIPMILIATGTYFALGWWTELKSDDRLLVASQTGPALILLLWLLAAIFPVREGDL